jgi:Zn-dependent protease
VQQISGSKMDWLLRQTVPIKFVLIVVSIASWSLIFSLKLALVAIAVIVVHEYGHYYMAKRFNVKTLGIFIIPFFGGATVFEPQKISRKANVFISLGGPLAGAIMATLCTIVFVVTKSQFMAGIAAVTAFINLLNLAPFLIMDGKGVVNVLTHVYGPRVRTISLSITLFLSFVTLTLTEAAGFFFISVIALYQLISPHPLDPHFSDADKDKAVKPPRKVQKFSGARSAARLYAGLAFFLAGLLWFVIISSHGYISILHAVGA